MAGFERLLVKKYQLWTLYLNEYQCYLGRCYLALNREGNLDPFADCTDGEWSELRDIVRDSLQPALARLFAPDLLNYDNLRNVWPHCHWHVIPRYAAERTFAGISFTDANWGANWSPYDKGFKVPEEALLGIRDAMLAELD